MPGPMDRLLEDKGLASAFEALCGLSGADLTSFLLEVMRSRAGSITASDVARRHAENRFTKPSAVPLEAMRMAEDTMLGALSADFEGLALSPVAPFGVHAAFGAVDQNNVVSALRSLEVAADPTVGLALEAVMRRTEGGSLRDAGTVRLMTAQRVTRAQRFDGPNSFPHFTIAGLVTAGRDTGSLRFERHAVVEHVQAHARALAACGADEVQVEFAALDGRLDDVAATLREAGLTVAPAARRAGYYTHAAFTVAVRFGDEIYDVGDGGFVDWSQRILSDARERMMTSGLGVDRIAMGMTRR